VFKLSVKMKTTVTTVFWVVLLGLSILSAQAQKYGENTKIQHRHSIDIFPFAPLIDIYGIHYIYQLTPKDELITGLSYMSIKKKSGITHSPALILGYRRYLWKNLHIEYELWPCYDDFWESTEKRYYSGFDLWNEFRVGYRFDFNVKGLPLYANVQWPFGFGLYSSNKPESFVQEVKEAPYFYHIPMLFVGVRF